MSTLSASLRAIGAIGPGFNDWDELRLQLTGAPSSIHTHTIIPVPATLPPAERRRVGKVVKLAIATGLQTCGHAGANPASLTTVFVSSGGDGDNCHTICETLASDDRLISPTRFHNSVNNAASGYWGIATGAQAPSTIVSAYDGSAGAGLLEAMAQLATGDCQSVLMICYDAPYPAPLGQARPIMDAMGVGLLLTTSAVDDALVNVRVALSDEHVTPMHDAELEHLRQGIPTARLLPLLSGVARAIGGKGHQRCVLELLPGAHLTIDIDPTT
ncbi:beta-ketoacyl synthase chain length factor [Nitrogeniibacter aestuarii]|uniref:beta-ketoacyl synthase chain length factor n=1 Tax=Nitrogeniibacter aestuarii TaxID=2815343 RepID=UPI001D10A67E|nr:beta-ketoacyl synthase chain length factor [Nitrogeniibacter aestuarii]